VVYPKTENLTDSRPLMTVLARGVDGELGVRGRARARRGRRHDRLGWAARRAAVQGASHSERVRHKLHARPLSVEAMLLRSGHQLHAGTPLPAPPVASNAPPARATVLELPAPCGAKRARVSPGSVTTADRLLEREDPAGSDASAHLEEFLKECPLRKPRTEPVMGRSLTNWTLHETKTRVTSKMDLQAWAFAVCQEATRKNVAVAADNLSHLARLHNRPDGSLIARWARLLKTIGALAAVTTALHANMQDVVAADAGLARMYGDVFQCPSVNVDAREMVVWLDGLREHTDAAVGALARDGGRGARAALMAPLEGAPDSPLAARGGTRDAPSLGDNF
jgi:hypothetical protein